VKTVVFVHGLEGRPDGTKPTALRAAGFEVVAPDGRGLSLAARVAGALAALDRHPGAILVGSSYGGLAAAWIATLRGDDLHALVLLAPALHHAEPPVVDPASLRVPPGLPVRVLHATGDAVVPVEVSRRFVACNPHASLTELDDAHDLRGSLPAIVEAVRGVAALPGR
jgi:pimeloyl-ACP methyl ester carboxylesterase